MSSTRDTADLLGQLPATQALIQQMISLVTSSGLSLTDQSERVAGGIDGGASLILAPEDTTQQMNFARSSTALARSSAGVVTSVAIDGLRYDYRWDGAAWVAAGFLIEDQRTNLIQRNSLFNTGPWTGAAVVTANATTAPDNSAEADTVADSTTAVADRNTGLITVAANSTIEVSIYLKRVAGTNAPSIRAAFSGGTSRQPEAVFDIDNGLGQSRQVTGAEVVTARVGKAANGFWRCGFTYTDTGNNTAVSVALRPAYAASYTTAADVNATGGVHAWGADLKVGVGITSMIPTPVSATVTRAADVLTKPLSSRLSRIAMTTLFTCRLLPGSAGGMLWQYDDGSNSSRIFVAVESGRIVLRTANAGTFTGYVPGPVVAADTDYAIAFSWNRITGELLLRVNGQSYLATATLIPKPTWRRIGSDASGGGQPNAWINPVRAKPADPALSATEFLRTLSPAELAAFV